jgi:hypothetical protein
VCVCVSRCALDVPWERIGAMTCGFLHVEGLVPGLPFPSKTTLLTCELHCLLVADVNHELPTETEVDRGWPARLSVVETRRAPRVRLRVSLPPTCCEAGHPKSTSTTPSRLLKRQDCSCVAGEAATRFGSRADPIASKDQMPFSTPIHGHTLTLYFLTCSPCCRGITCCLTSYIWSS